jgi:hypothetical protein
MKDFFKNGKIFFLEKTHPNTGLVEKLIDDLPNAKFIGIKRAV